MGEAGRNQRTVGRVATSQTAPATRPTHSQPTTNPGVTAVNYLERRAMEARHKPQMLRIAHQHTRIVNTDLETDRAGIDARMDPSTFGLRVRTPDWLEKPDLTIRFQGRNPGGEEWDKLMADETADAYLVAFEAAGDHTAIAAWWIINMHVLHTHVVNHVANGTKFWTTHHVGNSGTAFHAISMADLEQRGCVIASSEPLTPVQTTLPVT